MKLIESDDEFVTEKKFYVYLLKCADNSLYCGYTDSPQKRLEKHNKGIGAKYTMSRRPVELVYLEEHLTKQAAMHRECEIKKLSRSEKLVLVKNYEQKMYVDIKIDR